MADILISGATLADAVILNALVPPTKGIPCGLGCAPIPDDWLEQCKAGAVVPGCTSVALDADSALVVSTDAQARLKNDALIASLKLDASRVDAIKAKVEAGKNGGATAEGTDLSAVAAKPGA